MEDAPLINHISPNMMDLINLQARVCDFITPNKAWNSSNLINILPQRTSEYYEQTYSNHNIEDKMTLFYWMVHILSKQQLRLIMTLYDHPKVKFINYIQNSN